MLKLLKYFLGGIIGLVVIVAVVIFAWSSQAIKANAKYHYVGTLPNNTGSLTLPPFGVFILDQYQDDPADNPSTARTDAESFWDQYQEIGLIEYYKFHYDKYIAPKESEDGNEDRDSEESGGENPEQESDSLDESGE